MLQYRAFGLSLASELELLHLESVSGDPPEVRINSADLSEVRAVHGLEDVARAFIATDSGVVMHWRDVGTVLVSDGTTIQVDFEPQVDPSIRTLALTGPPLGVLLEQRGNLVLHGSAVVMDSKAVAFLGHKGLGKSTTAAALAQAGYPVLTDDILAIDTESDTFFVRPGLPMMKLWPASSTAIYGPSEEGGDDHADKQLRIADVNQQDHFSLGAVFVLDIGETGAEAVHGKEAFISLMRNSYSGRFAGSEGTPPAHFVRCTKVASSVPVFHLKRRPDLSTLPQVVSVVEATVRSL